eukprot:g27336.t1
MGGLRSTQRAEWQCRLNTLFTAPTSHGKKSGKSDEYPGKFFSDDEWLVIQSLADEVGEQQRQVYVTETSVSRVEDSTGGVDGGEGGLVQLVHGEDGVLSGGSGVATQVGENKAESKRNAANPLAPRVENKRNRNGVPVTWDGAAVTTTNIVSQPRNRERTRPSNFRSGAFLVTIPVPYREATASGKFNESRFADIDKHLKLGAIVEPTKASREQYVRQLNEEWEVQEERWTPMDGCQDALASGGIENGERSRGGAYDLRLTATGGIYWWTRALTRARKDHNVLLFLCFAAGPAWDSATLSCAFANLVFVASTNKCG